MPRPPLTAIGVAGTTVGCAAMAASLPAGVAGALGSLGIGGTSAFTRALGGAAQPLFIVSALALVAGALLCSRSVAALAAFGGVLLYLSMFELARGGSGGGSMTMMSMDHAHPARAEPVSFFLGLAGILASIALQLWRRRHGRCRPLLRLHRLV